MVTRPSRGSASAICPCSSVYLTALVNKLRMICENRTGSACVQTGSLGKDNENRCWRSSRSGLISSAVCRIHHFHRLLLSWILPCVIRETSSRSSTSRTMCSTCRFIKSRAHTAVAGSVSIANNSSALRIGAKGLRSSWARTARNSSLHRSAAQIVLRCGAGPTPIRAAARSRHETPDNAHDGTFRVSNGGRMSSIGCSLPDFEISSVWFHQADDSAFLQRANSGVCRGLTRVFIDDREGGFQRLRPRRPRPSRSGLPPRH